MIDAAFATESKNPPSQNARLRRSGASDAIRNPMSDLGATKFSVEETTPSYGIRSRKAGGESIQIEGDHTASRVTRPGRAGTPLAGAVRHRIVCAVRGRRVESDPTPINLIEPQWNVLRSGGPLRFSLAE